MMLSEIPFLSQSVCYLAEMAISGNPIFPSFDFFDIREDCKHPLTCVDYYDLELYLNNGPFKRAAGGFGKWDACDNIVLATMLMHAQFNYGHLLAEVLEKDVAVLVYNGDKDYMGNWIGAEQWTNALPWRYQDQYVKETYMDWRANDKVEEP